MTAVLARGDDPVVSLPRVLWRSFTAGFNLTSTDKAALAARAWFYAVVTSVLASMWRIAISVNNNGSGVGESGVGGSGVDGVEPSVAGYTAVAIFWYIAAAEAALIPVPSNLIEQVAKPIADESVEVWFSRPVYAGLPTVLFRFGQILPVSLACALTGCVLAIVLAGPPPNLVALLLALPALCLAVLLSIAMQHTFAGLAFWLGDISGMWLVYHRTVFILGGLIIPLETLPSWLEPVARAMPFMATVYVPGRLASGHVEPTLIVRQLFWLVIALGAVALVYRRGEERMCRRNL